MKLLIVFSALSLVCGAGYASDPGNRADKTPWFGFGSLSKEIIDVQSDIVSTQSEMIEEIREINDDYRVRQDKLRAERAGAGMFGLPFLTDSRSDYDEKLAEVSGEQSSEVRELRSEYREDLSEYEADLVDALASPRNSEVRGKYDSVRPGTASREALEVYNSLANLEQVVVELNSSLQADPSDYQLAVETYDKQIMLAKYVIKINQTYKDRLRRHYIPGLEDVASRADNSLSKMDGNEDMDADVLARQKEHMKSVKSGVEAALPKLESHIDWVEANISDLRSSIKVISTLRENVKIARDASGMIGEINAATQKIDLSLPEIVEWDLKKSDLSLESVM